MDPYLPRCWCFRHTAAQAQPHARWCPWHARRHNPYCPTAACPAPPPQTWPPSLPPALRPPALPARRHRPARCPAAPPGTPPSPWLEPGTGRSSRPGSVSPWCRGAPALLAPGAPRP
uniref:Uncharacterized protein n=1 Tax=Zea mays TaxID=4577 RepID=C0PC36_MAIZE|nr:unknown [Zea mays]